MMRKIQDHRTQECRESRAPHDVAVLRAVLTILRPIYSCQLPDGHLHFVREVEGAPELEHFRASANQRANARGGRDRTARQPYTAARYGFAGWELIPARGAVACTPTTLGSRVANHTQLRARVNHCPQPTIHGRARVHPVRGQPNTAARAALGALGQPYTSPAANRVWLL